MDNIFNRAHEIYNGFFNPYKNLTPTELNNKLLEASKKGNLSEVTALLGYGADINTTDDDKRTPLMWTCANEHPDIVAYLLENKANTELKDRNGSTAVMFAATTNKNTVILECLIKNGADINAKKYFGENALMIACHEGKTDIAEWLIKNGANIKATNKNGSNALMYACLNSHTGTAAFLLQNGADINATNSFGDNALIVSCGNGDINTTALLLQYSANIKATNYLGENALMIARQADKTDTVFLLLNSMTPEEREEFASQNDENFEIVNDFEKDLNEKALSVREEIETLQKIDVINIYDSNFKILPSELKCIIRAFEVKLTLKEQFKDSWYRFSVPVLFLNKKRKAEGEPEENNRSNKKICASEKMKTDDSFEPTIFSKKK